jgi:hypothetical protein
MMKLLILIACMLNIVLWTGYYETRWTEDEDDQIVFFIKKKPSLQFRFVNIFASYEDPKPLERLDEEDVQYANNYCKYTLGIETEIKTQKDLDACAQAFYDTLKNNY